MAIAFKKATKKKARLRMALCGPSGSGKTYTALNVGTGLAQGGKVLVLDTERGSASKYADQFTFDCFDEWDQVGGYNPERLMEAIGEAAKQGYAVVVIDSLSHFWFGTGGELEMVDKAAKRSQSGNSFAAWKEVTPVHNRLVDTLLSSPLHVICTLRTKTEWVIEENERGRKVPRKIGTAPIMRDGIEFEFDVCGDMDQDNTLIVTKTRCSALAGQAISKPGDALAKTLVAWLSDGDEAPEHRTAPVDAEPINPALKGSKEAAQAVAQERIAELTSRPLPAAAPSDVNPEHVVIEAAKKGMGGLLAIFAAIKQQLFIATGNNEAYYRILGAAGYEHANQLKGKPVREWKELYCELWSAYTDAKHGVSSDDIAANSTATKGVGSIS